MKKEELENKIEDIEGIKRVYAYKSLTEGFDAHIKIYNDDVTGLQPDRDEDMCVDCKFNNNCELQNDLMDMFKYYKNEIETFNPIICRKFENKEDE